jgi:hypothetical protein
MKLKNDTAWDSKKLKKFLIQCKNYDDKIEGKLRNWQNKELTVHVVYIKKLDHCYYDGYAYLRGAYMRLRVPSPNVIKYLDLKQLAYLFFHEYMHIRGYRHRQMNDRYSYDFIEEGFREKKLDVITAIEKPVEVKVKPTQEDKVEKKLNIAKRRLVKAENMLKRATKLIKKWKSKVKYYEKKRCNLDGGKQNTQDSANIN